MTFLEKILAEKQKEVERLKADGAVFEPSGRKAASLYETFMHAEKTSIIAEIKRASPSKGDIKTSIDPVRQSIHYEKAGAGAISVLTDETFFKGSVQDLKAVSDAVKLPVLCKDFIIDEIQIERAKANGASVILLIAAALAPKRLKQLYAYAHKQGLEVLLEVHHEAELEIALAMGANIIGINNRNLKTFEVDLGVVERLAGMIRDPNILVISESGIRTRKDVLRAEKAGAKAILVGETFMRAGDPEKTIKQLIGVPEKRKVKICGIRTLEAAKAAVEAGADMIGFVFADSRRKITPEKATQIAAQLPRDIEKVGVFVNEKPEIITKIADIAGLDYVQLHGDETPEQVAAIPYPVIKACAVQSRKDIEGLQAYRCDMVLLDSPKGKYRGGNGTAFDWELAKDLSKHRTVILAGGLSAENVAEAIFTARPQIVDVSSGVETDGEKDTEKIFAFTAAAKNAFNKIEERDSYVNL
ncbi:indole-3-glycerol phosphate synthase TrpC [Heyndrickxia acidiproducens]|uniref:indole-3-glycerol phosphate synthase TrpC n=1 Tax=Heyndrickxia acidiproducens TaxID=1121084 RepID=UPI000379F9AD|nr:indole-3-glycerol phosphate synthase TrpC [Heyndrickxia acidiproducens]